LQGAFFPVSVNDVVQDESQRVRLSVVVATVHPWPELAVCLDALVAQVRETQSELIVADGDGQGIREDVVAAHPGITWLKEPGGSVFRLRALGVRAAKGAIIATTEDHCVVRPEWCTRILEAHEQHPEAVAVAGSVVNGSQDRLIDWANFLHTFGSFISPIDQHQRERCPTNSNISYKRHVFEEALSEDGWMETCLNPKLFREGRFIFDDRIVVAHTQSHGFLGTFRAHFHNGRATTGLRHARLSTWQSPWRLLHSALKTVRGKRHVYMTVAACLPLLALLSCCHAAGELVGILAGPGKSPERLN